MIIKLFKNVVQVVQTVLVTNVTETPTKEKSSALKILLSILQKCITILRRFVYQDARMKNELIPHVRDFLEFTRFNVGQSDLIADLFVDNPFSNFDEKKKVIDYFVNKIISEGNQTRFLNFFEAVVENEKQDQSSTLSTIFDTLLPYKLPTKHTDNLKIIYGFINQNTGEHEMFLNDDFAAFQEDNNDGLIVYKCQPFLFHHKLLRIYLKMLESSLANIARIRIRRYFSLSYIIRFLSEYDDFFDSDYDDAVQEGIDVEEMLLSKADPKERTKRGITYLKPIMAELLYKAHCQGEANLYRTVVPSLNNISNLVSKECERLESTEGQYSSEYSSYVSYLLKVAHFHSVLRKNVRDENEIYF
jgi:hypothetical protein